jgi:hypothetical protein
MVELKKIPFPGTVILTVLFFTLSWYWIPMLLVKAGSWALLYAVERILGTSGRYSKNQLISLDQHGAALLGFDPDIVISALCQVYDFWLFNLLRPVLNWIDPGHTRAALEAERGISTSNIFFK